MENERPRHPKQLRQNFAANLKIARRLCGLTQAGLAELSGLHTTAIQGFEKGANAPSLDSLEAISIGLRLPPAVLLAQPEEALPQMTSLVAVGYAIPGGRGRVT